MVTTERDRILEGLNDAQQEAVMTTMGPLLVVAGPGSGKTRVITHRIAHIIKNLRMDPDGILAMTFTNKAAKEMENRSALMAGSGDRVRPRISTFHSFCARLLRAGGERVGIQENYSIYGEEEQTQVIKACMEELGLEEFSHREMREDISKSKNNLITHRETATRAEEEQDDYLAALAVLHEAYDRRLRENMAADFDDLLTMAVELLEDHPGVRERLQRRYHHVMVDEFQDTNLAQYRLTRLLSGGRNICVVGDPDQSIYSWRSADPRNVERFMEDHPGARIIRLGQNYRSTANIVARSKNLIENNFRPVPNELYTANPEGEPVSRKKSHNEREEAEWIVSEIQRMTAEEGRNPGDFAVMYRTNACSKPVEEVCVSRGMKYRITGATEFYRRKEIKDITAYLRMIHNPMDSVSLLRVLNVPPRGIGPRSVRKLSEWATEEGLPLHRAIGAIARREIPAERTGLQKKAYESVAGFGAMARRLFDASRETDAAGLMDLILKETGFESHLMRSGPGAEERWENVLTCRNTARELAGGGERDSLREFLDHVALMSQADNQADGDGALTLINIHQAKGLEFPVVFLIGMEQGLLPHVRSMRSEEDFQEERRLCYVAVTRAKEKLFLSRSLESRGFRTRDGETKGYGAQVSDFTLEMFPEEL